MGRPTSTGNVVRRRPFLASVATVGLVAGLLGMAGVFAASTDRATTDGDRVATGELLEPHEVDLQIAPVVNGGCGAWQEDLTTGIFAVTAATEDVIGRDEFTASVCLRNHGPSEGTLSILPIDLDDRDTACTGREAEVDGSCGNGQAGELAGALGLMTLECGTTETQSLDRGTLEEMAAGPRNLMTLPGRDASVRLCLTGRIIDDYSQSSFVQRRAQSDEVMWRFAFDLGAPGEGCQQLDDEPNSTFELPQTITPGTPVAGSICKHDRDIFRFWFSGTQRDRGFRVELTWDAGEGDLLFHLATDPTGSSSLERQETEGRTVILVPFAPGQQTFFAVVRGDPFGPDGPVTSSGYQLRVIPDLPPLQIPQ